MAGHPPPIADQVAFWDGWNAAAREHKLAPSPQRQGQEAEVVVQSMGRSDLDIIDVGCGTGWLCERLLPYSRRVLGIDLASTVLERARVRVPQVQFIGGDFFALDLPQDGFDVVISFEVLAHVADQREFVRRLATLLRPGGRLILSAQNRPVLLRWSVIEPPGPGQVRHWPDHRELRWLLAPHLTDLQITSFLPVGDRGWLRVANAPKVNRVLGALVGAQRLLHWKESLMLGQTLFATGVKV